MDPIKIHVQLADRGYSIDVGRNVLASAGRSMAAATGSRRFLIVTDDQVGPLLSPALVRSLRDEELVCWVATIPAGESSKSLQFASQLYDRLLDVNADRRTCVVALGGGVVGDLAGFVAATFARGVPFVQIPTTLLAMVDASVGGKVAVDHPRAKNMIGAFHQPKWVGCDLDALDTLPDRQYRAGLAEVVKYGVIQDAPFFEYLEAHVADLDARDPPAIQHIVATSCKRKAEVVEEDEFETTGRRAILNYGHTFAHAFETLGGYRALLHGEAVAIGMICAAELATRMGIANPEVNQRQRALWPRLRLPTTLPFAPRVDDLLEVMRRDKKSVSGSLRLVLPLRMGHVEVVPGVEESLVRQILGEAGENG